MTPEQRANERLRRANSEALEQARKHPTQDPTNPTQGPKRIATLWQDFRQAVLRGAPPTQVQEMRRAFYAGAAALLDMTTAISNDAVSEDDGVARLESLHEEMREWLSNLAEGRV